MRRRVAFLQREGRPQGGNRRRKRMGFASTEQVAFHGRDQGWGTDEQVQGNQQTYNDRIETAKKTKCREAPHQASVLLPRNRPTGFPHHPSERTAVRETNRSQLNYMTALAMRWRLRWRMLLPGCDRRPFYRRDPERAGDIVHGERRLALRREYHPEAASRATNH